MRALAALGLAALALGGCEEQHGFLKIGASVLFDRGETLACGEAEIAPKPDGLIDAFVTLKPQDCVLTLRRPGDFLGLGTKLCTLHIANNRLTTAYLSESGRSLACSVGSG